MTQAMASGPDCISAITTLFHRFEAYARDNTAAYLRRSGVLKAEEGCARDASEPVTVFHTREYIAMPLVDLAFIMQRGINCNMETLLVALIIMCRFSHYAKVPVTRHMVHRLYVACLHVAMKTHCDAFYANSAFAQRAGVSLPEMNRLEVYVLNGIQWRATVMLDTSSVDEGLSPTSPIAAARHQTLQAQQHQQRVAASSSFGQLLSLTVTWQGRCQLADDVPAMEMTLTVPSNKASRPTPPSASPQRARSNPRAKFHHAASISIDSSHSQSFVAIETPSVEVFDFSGELNHHLVPSAGRGRGPRR
jgi:hypothetical protein